MEEILIKAMRVGATFEIQYFDYTENQWTIPVKITPDRLDNAVNDNSVKNIRITIENK